tara:strand:+ start:3536 stop:4420 length:885 start_codon:yes stop_codon:yes gene_type:complete
MILFVGCSFTWGSGLQYEYLHKKGWGIDELNKILPYNYHLELLDYGADEYRKTHSWPNLVSKEMNKSFVLGTYSNGGTNMLSILDSIEHTHRYANKRAIELVVVQFTSWTRDIPDIFGEPNLPYQISRFMHNVMNWSIEKIKKHIPSTNSYSEEYDEPHDTETQEFIDNEILRQIKTIADKCNELVSNESGNIKTHEVNSVGKNIVANPYPKWIGVSWLPDLGNVLKKHYPENFIPIYYKGKEYVSFNDIIHGNQLRLCDTFLGLDDEHFNSDGCKVVADSIVRKLKQYESTTN